MFRLHFPFIAMSRLITKEKKLAVLQVVKENKDVLFGTFENIAVRKQEKERAWKDVLKKAQSLGLASTNREWSYARDHIFGLWKSRTLFKKNNPTRRTASGKAFRMNTIDETILEILGMDSEVVEDVQNPKADGVKVSQKDLQRQKKQELPQPFSSTQLDGAKIHAADSSSIEFLKGQVLKSELYRNKLQILQLERKLGLPPSKFTNDLGNF